MNWHKNLANAPKVTADNIMILALLEGDEIPLFVLWREYDEDLKDELGEDGYWDYRENLISDVTGGVQKEQIESALWAEFDLSPVLDLRNVTLPFTTPI